MINLNYFDLTGSDKNKFEPKYRPYISCDQCVFGTAIPESKYVKCIKYNMRSLKDSTCKSSEKK